MKAFEAIGERNIDGRHVVDGREVHAGDVLQLQTDEREWVTFRYEWDHSSGKAEPIAVVSPMPGGGRMTFKLSPRYRVRWLEARHG